MLREQLRQIVEKDNEVKKAQEALEVSQAREEELQQQLAALQEEATGHLQARQSKQVS